MSTTPDRPTRLRVIGFALPLFLVLVVAVILGLETLAATRDHRNAAEQTLHDYAGFAAVLVSNAAHQEIERRLLYAFAPLRRYDATAHAPLPPPSVLALDRAEASRCAGAVRADIRVRVALADGSVELDGDALPDSTLRWLADTLAVDAATSYGERWSFAHLFTDRTGLDLVAYSVLRDDAGQPIAVYAKTSCLDIDGEPMFRSASRGAPALPPSLTGGLPNDSLFSFRATDPFGRVVQSSDRDAGYGATGHAGPLPQLGGLVFEVTLRRRIEPVLVAGGIPYARAALTVGLLLMILVLSVLTLLQLRRHQELVRLRERFISNVSHELRTPLQQILVFSELLGSKRIEAEAERQHSIQVIERETRRLIHMVENVLRFSRTNRTGIPVELRPVELNAIVRETAASFEPLAKSGHATLRVDAESEVMAVADADAVRRVLLNLLDNAVKYGPPGQTIVISLHRRPDRGTRADASGASPPDKAIGGVATGESGTTAFAVLEVADQGPGIPVEERERVFRPFHRLAREDRSGIAGSGVGLSIVRDLVDRMHGDVRVDESHEGARFVVRLPAGPFV